MSSWQINSKRFCVLIIFSLILISNGLHIMKKKYYVFNSSHLRDGDGRWRGEGIGGEGRWRGVGRGDGRQNLVFLSVRGLNAIISIIATTFTRVHDFACVYNWYRPCKLCVGVGAGILEGVLFTYTCTCEQNEWHLYWEKFTSTNICTAISSCNKILLTTIVKDHCNVY